MQPAEAARDEQDEILGLGHRIYPPVIAHPALCFQLLAVLARRELGPGETLCGQDEPADAMYFIESGRVSIELRLPDGSHRRLRTMGPKTVLGEMGLYREARRSASVVVQEASVVYVLDAVAMQRLEANAPAAASRFHAMVVRTIADRLQYSNALVTALQR